MDKVTAATALLAGGLLGSGLLLAGVAEPARVQALLTPGPGWQPQLVLVPAVAALLAMPAYWKARRHNRTLRGQSALIPRSPALTPKLALGCLLFGIGWAWQGLSPAAGLVRAGGGDIGAGIFSAALLAGIFVTMRGEAWWRRYQTARSARGKQDGQQTRHRRRRQSGSDHDTHAGDRPARRHGPDSHG